MLYNTPKDSAAFDRHYHETHIPLAKKIPGLGSLSINDGPVQALSGTAPYLVAILNFASMGDLVTALASPEGRATADDLQASFLKTGRGVNEPDQNGRKLEAVNYA